MVIEFKKAERRQAKLRLALCSPSGGGKTFSALKIAKGLGGKIAMIDTEHGSGSLYADTVNMPEYAVLELDAPYTPTRYIEAITAAEKAGYNVIIIDSLSHAWSGEGGVLEMQESSRAASKSGNSWTAWRDVTPKHNQLVNAILQSSSHIIATMRSKQEYAQIIPDGGGKAEVRKLGMAPVQREGMDYEFTVVFDLTIDHLSTASKDRTGLFDGQHFKPSEDTGKKLLHWLEQGKPAEVKTRSVDTTTGEIIEPPAIEPKPEPKHFCDLHRTAFQKHEKDGKIWYSHKLSDGKYCNESKAIKQVVIQSEPPVTTDNKPKATPEAIVGLKPTATDRLPTLHPDYIKAVHASLTAQGIKTSKEHDAYVKEWYGANTVAQLTMDEANIIISAKPDSLFTFEKRE